MKLVKEYINEKFIEDGDPIHQMGIGLIDQLKKEYVKEPTYPWMKEHSPENVTLEDLLYHCMIRNKYGLDIIETLIDAGANVNAKNTEFLYLAVDRGMNFVKFFLDKGAKASNNKSNALGNAIRYRKFDIAELLIKHGASIKAVGNEELKNAINDNDNIKAKWILEKGFNPNGYSYRPLRYALKNKNYELVDILIKEYIKDRKNT